MRKKIKYLVFNLLTPGIGHLAMRKWIKGSVYLLATLCCIIWLMIGFKNSIIPLYQVDMDTPDSVFKAKNVISSLLIPIGWISIIWIISFIDLLIFTHPRINKPSTKDKMD